VPIGAVTSVAIERFAVEWRPAVGAPVRVVARGAEARADGSELELQSPRVEPGTAAPRAQFADGIRLISLMNP
jgi:hypothetical protein